jgi:hypothetical protein
MRIGAGRNARMVTTQKAIRVGNRRATTTNSTKRAVASTTLNEAKTRQRAIPARRPPVARLGNTSRGARASSRSFGNHSAPSTAGAHSSPDARTTTDAARLIAAMTSMNRGPDPALASPSSSRSFSILAIRVMSSEMPPSAKRIVYRTAQKTAKSAYSPGPSQRAAKNWTR